MNRQYIISENNASKKLKQKGNYNGYYDFSDSKIRICKDGKYIGKFKDYQEALLKLYDEALDEDDEVVDCEEIEKFKL